MTSNEADHYQASGNYFLLSKAITNIVKNAVEFSPDAGEITISTAKYNNRLIITICDQGKGIPGYAKDRIFERFYSLARPDGRKGSGLGLSFVKEIASLHHAEIRISDNPHSQQSTGTCFVFELSAQ